MRNTWCKGLLVSGLLFVGVTQALEIPVPGDRDPRIRYVDYRVDDVVLVKVRRGGATRVVLEADETIDFAASGFPSDCKKPELEWCIVAERGMNQFLIKPQDGATHNNFEVKTNKRDYSFDIKVLEDAPNGHWSSDSDKSKGRALVEEPMMRVIFRFPRPQMAALPEGLLGDVKPVVSETEQVKDLLDAQPVARNWKYTMKVGSNAQDIAPQIVFDDGRFTYFRYPKNRQVPAIFVIEPTGEEARVNFTMEGNELVAVQRLGRQFVLRHGDAVVGVWNEAFDGDGVAVQDGVTVDGVRRELK